MLSYTNSATHRTLRRVIFSGSIGALYLAPMCLLNFVPQHAKNGPILVHWLQDTVTGFLLAGVGQKDAKGQNFLVVDASELSVDAALHIVAE